MPGTSPLMMPEFLTSSDNCGGTTHVADSSLSPRSSAQGYETGVSGSCTVSLSFGTTGASTTGEVTEIHGAGIALDQHSIKTNTSSMNTITTTSVTPQWPIMCGPGRRRQAGGNPERELSVYGARYQQRIPERRCGRHARIGRSDHRNIHDRPTAAAMRELWLRQRRLSNCIGLLGVGKC